VFGIPFSKVQVVPPSILVYNPKSVGTIAFPVHSDLNVNRVNYFEDYLLDLKKLDKKFQRTEINSLKKKVINLLTIN
jgi:hypothetical protein